MSPPNFTLPNYQETDPVKQREFEDHMEYMKECMARSESGIAMMKRSMARSQLHQKWVKKQEMKQQKLATIQGPVFQHPVKQEVLPDQNGKKKLTKKQKKKKNKGSKHGKVEETKVPEPAKITYKGYEYKEGAIDLSDSDGEGTSTRGDWIAFKPCNRTAEDFDITDKWMIRLARKFEAKQIELMNVDTAGKVVQKKEEEENKKVEEEKVEIEEEEESEEEEEDAVDDNDDNEEENMVELLLQMGVSPDDIEKAKTFNDMQHSSYPIEFHDMESVFNWRAEIFPETYKTSVLDEIKIELATSHLRQKNQMKEEYKRMKPELRENYEQQVLETLEKSHKEWMDACAFDHAAIVLRQIGAKIARMKDPTLPEYSEKLPDYSFNKEKVLKEFRDFLVEETPETKKIQMAQQFAANQIEEKEENEDVDDEEWELLPEDDEYEDEDENEESDEETPGLKC